jgi:cell division cycle 20-like protein 1, cofactor of APC complex
MSTPNKRYSYPFSPFTNTTKHVLNRKSTDSGRNSMQTSEITPTKFYSPSPNSKEKLGDRFIPCRASTNLADRFLSEENFKNPRTTHSSSTLPSHSHSSDTNAQTSQPSTRDEQQIYNYSQLLQTQFFRDENNQSTNLTHTDTATTLHPHKPSLPPNIFRFKSESKKPPLHKASPIISLHPDHFISANKEQSRKIAKMPFKVLDAPQLQDDFYLNLVDWSSLNVLAVGLGSAVYVWSACTSKVTKLCEVPRGDSITSLSWSQRGTHLAVGTHSGETQIWDSAHVKMVRNMAGHTGRVSTSAWNSSVLSTGSRDRNILQRDLRGSDDFIMKLAGHKQEVCGLKWSFDGQQLASGGNDNKLFLWNLQNQNPLAKFSEHCAAVKAIAWSPHQHGLLASGGGTADRCIRFWNTLTMDCVKSLDTGSQVCNLIFSKNVNELVSTHGYSLNQIIIWKYPSMVKVNTLTGHTYRVLYLSMSPCGQSIVTGAGDETLRFWNVFPSIKTKTSNVFGCSSSLIPSSMDIR